MMILEMDLEFYFLLKIEKLLSDFGKKINKMVLENLLIIIKVYMENGKKEKW